MRETLIDKGQALVEQARYFTITERTWSSRCAFNFAPRQAGKTTYFQLLFRRLQQSSYTPIWISLEGLKTLTRDDFYKTLTFYLHRELTEYGIHVNTPITNQIDLQIYIGEISAQSQPLVLVIDEFENIPAVVLNEVMHTFRAMYQKRQYHKALYAFQGSGPDVVNSIARYQRWIWRNIGYQRDRRGIVR